MPWSFTFLQVVVVGGSILDFTAKIRSPQVEVSPCVRRSVISICMPVYMLVMCSQSEGTNLGSLMQSFGGVARNVAGKLTQSHFILSLLLLLLKCGSEATPHPLPSSYILSLIFLTSSSFPPL